MQDERFILTRAGYETLEQELNDLVTRQTQKMAEQLADVHEDTDWGEEATFFDAMVEKERLDERINHLHYVLEHAEVINGDNDPELVDPGDRVTLWDLNTDEEVIYDLIGSEEVAHGRHGVSIKSPVGHALIGHRIGDVVEVQIPDGIARYTIRKIVPLAEVIPESGH